MAEAPWHVPIWKAERRDQRNTMYRRLLQYGPVMIQIAPGRDSLERAGS